MISDYEEIQVNSAVSKGEIIMIGDYDYKTDSQIIMIALAKLLRDEHMSIVQELTKRGEEQTMHIPYHVRIQKQKGGK